MRKINLLQGILLQNVIQASTLYYLGHTTGKLGLMQVCTGSSGTTLKALNRFLIRKGFIKMNYTIQAEQNVHAQDNLGGHFSQSTTNVYAN